MNAVVLEKTYDFEEYHIYQHPSTKKYGIRMKDGGSTILLPAFDDIEWWESERLVVFTLDGKKAVYDVDRIMDLIKPIFK